MSNKVYRLEDDTGNTVFSDQVRPEQAKYKRELLNNSARVLEVTERAKSKEQQALERRLDALRKQQDKLIAEQKLRDNALLSTYHTKEEIFAALKIKMDSFANQLASMEGNLRHVDEQLRSQQKIAANLERDEQKVPKKLLDDIESSHKQIKQIRDNLVLIMDRQRLTKSELMADVDRYLFLTQTHKKPENGGVNIPSIKEANALGLFYCENDHQCNKAWEIARSFVNQHSTTKPDVFNEKLIMNRPPATDTDISLSLSRIPITENEFQLFLDIHCHESVVGQELCESDKVRKIRTSFRSFVNESLSVLPE
ncbi:hypothetical protein JCM14076_02290 [Methylosoma difficile]